jgi:RimJ/RimL family protein N-acetyltransferase
MLNIKKVQATDVGRIIVKHDAKQYHLILLTEEYFRDLYNWNRNENKLEQFTCRPIKLTNSYDEYFNKMMAAIRNVEEKNFILVDSNNDNVPLGKIKLFDYNARNHSAEFGYYLPELNRNKGLGGIMLEQFLKISFTDSNYSLNKLYATLASYNIPSKKLLEKYEFKLDGRLREHYWIKENKYDQFVYSLLKSEWEISQKQ